MRIRHPGVPTSPSEAVGNFRNSEITHPLHTDQHTAEAGTPSNANPLVLVSQHLDDQLRELLENCRSHLEDDRELVFGSKERRLQGMLPAYRLHHLVSANPTLEPQLRDAYDKQADRERALKKDGLSLVVLYLTLRPGGRPEYRICSEIAPMIEHAAHQGVEPDGFVEWGRPVTFESATKATRDRRRRAKKARIETENGDAEGTSVGLDVPNDVVSEAADGVKLTISLTTEAGGKLATITSYVTQAAGSRIEQAMREHTDGAYPIACAIADILAPARDVQVASEAVLVPTN